MSDDAAKSALRAQLRAARRALTPQQRDHERQALCRALTLLSRLCDHVAAYWPMADEADLSPWCQQRWAQGHSVWLPRVVGAQLAWHPITNRAQLTPGAHGISEPDAQRIPAQPLPASTLICVPGLGFSLHGRRIGQGGGYYDRLLATRPATWKVIGIGWSCQWLDTLPEEAHDQRCDAVLIAGRLIAGRPLPGRHHPDPRRPPDPR